MRNAGGHGPGSSLQAELARVDVSRPWFAPLRSLLVQALTALQQPEGEQAPAAWAVLNTLRQAQAAADLPSFADAAVLPADTAYETHIFTKRQIPTRENLHDVLNGLIWLRYPQLKRQLNTLQAAEIQRLGATHLRGALRDALTLFDESGLALSVPDAVWEALVQHAWQRALFDLRPLWAQAQVHVIGHGLLEQLCLKPHLGLTARVLRLPFPLRSTAVDAALAQAWQALTPQIQAGRKPFTPLPVCGIPAWHGLHEGEAAQNAAFYANLQVFRPKNGEKQALEGLK